MTTRRYDDDEVSEILARATGDRGGVGEPPGREGLTLEELQAIGADVGIEPDRIAEAAGSLERRMAAPPVRTFLGAPRSVARTVPLERQIDDEEWGRLVAELRATFGAVGNITTAGPLRTWSNGNLQAHVEPEGDGWRLRMQTLKGDTPAAAGIGTIFSLIGVAVAMLAAIGGVDENAPFVALAFLAAGLTQLGLVRLSLPRWADERAEQMEAVAARLPVLLKP